MELERKTYENETTDCENTCRCAEIPGQKIEGADDAARASLCSAGRSDAGEGADSANDDVRSVVEEDRLAHEADLDRAIEGEGDFQYLVEAVERTQRVSCDAYPDTELDEDNCAAHNSYLGRRGEEAAVRYLEGRGFEILERNWRCCAGEADIIAYDEDDLVFIEVKTRSNIRLGLPSEAVDAQKRSRYEKIAALYLKDFDRTDLPVRFDVIGILVTSRDRALLRHHVNAFATAC